jgi:ABC-type bacteriocin/lantibiotic exporter with double-glycine peptidase domain
MDKRILKFGLTVVFVYIVIYFVLLLCLNVKSNPTYGSGMESEICGLTAVVNICSLHGVRADFIELCKYIATTDEKETTLLACKEALEQLGINSKAVRFKSIANLPQGVPILCVLRKEKGLHAAVTIRRGGKVLLIDGQKIERFSVDHMDDYAENVALVTQKVNEKFF